ncbi:hypothetical protein [Streptomyces sp. NRRL S-481]|uniref:hypothetical protein n=1 Tax=Streptomyces sp. NRRL S-481 TaxID=1463911 RepID=UPI00190085BC|nr:hypothetical protein [Streptomyces sp. NRRL S-481]
MSEKLPAVALLAVALLGVLAPSAAAAPLPIPAAGEPLITEGLSIEGPLINNVSLPTSK